MTIEVLLDMIENSIIFQIKQNSELKWAKLRLLSTCLPGLSKLYETVFIFTCGNFSKRLLLKYL